MSARSGLPIYGLVWILHRHRGLAGGQPRQATLVGHRSRVQSKFLERSVVPPTDK